MNARILARVLPALLLVGTACETRTFSFYADPVEAGAQPRPDGGVRDASRPDVRSIDLGGFVDARPDGAPCFPQAEICNGADDDCDGQADEGFEFFTDITNCGRCGNLCTFEHAAATCTAGKCILGDCADGFADRDGIGVNGCECAITNAGVEICDELDNDCDGKTDEGFDLATNVLHCGACRRACTYDNATPGCADGRCQIGACADGWVNLDGFAQTGCEYQCAISNDGVEICDGKDNNCNGKTDEGDARVGMRCFPPGQTGCNAASGQCNGGCKLGTWACLPGGLTCQGATLAQQEICDGADNDCDAMADEDFDLQNDPRWCGQCTGACKLPDAIAGCALGQCTVAICRSGFVDLDGAAGNGCEYACTRDGPEVCDSKDNDCDGKTDEQDDDLRFPPQNFCNQVGECGRGPGGSTRYPGAATYPVCTTPAGLTTPDWYCNYPATVQLFAPNQVLGQETWCDALDNDCDGATDEHTNPRTGTDCKDDGLGECQKTGVLRCQGDRTLSPACDVSGVADRLPSHESCDARDNDCDGVTDEAWDNPAGATTCGGGPCLGVRDDVVHVTASGNDYYIYQYEASRPDANKASAGTVDARACSGLAANQPRLPWTSITHPQATAACAAAGMRLCRTQRNMPCSSTAIAADEWGFACGAGLICPGNQPRAYPYACDYQPATCNGLDAGLGGALPSGAAVACITPDLDDTQDGAQTLFDMSGNVAEWTEDCRGVLADGSGRLTHTLRGGSSANIPRALRCDFMALVVASDFTFTDTGFRCCSSCAPGLADCNGGCVSLGTDNAHCGACNAPCVAGTSCSNGRCQ